MLFILAMIFIISANSLGIERSGQITVFKKRLKEIIQKGIMHRPSMNAVSVDEMKEAVKKHIGRK